MTIIDIESTLKKNFLIIVFIVSALLHLGEGAMSAINYAESAVTATTSTSKYVITWIVGFIVFIGVASVSFSCAVAIPSALRNIKTAHKDQKGIPETVIFLLVVMGCYIGMQYFFLYVNLLFANAIDTNRALESVNLVNFTLNQVKIDTAITVKQAHTAIIEILIVYVNLSFEVMLSSAFAFLDVSGGSTIKK